MAFSKQIKSNEFQTKPSKGGMIITETGWPVTGCSHVVLCSFSLFFL